MAPVHTLNHEVIIMKLKPNKKTPKYYIDESGDKFKVKWVTSVEKLLANQRSLKAELRATYEDKRTKHSGSWGVYFRGQEDIGDPLLPSIGRKYIFAGRSVPYLDKDQERNLLHRFRRASYNHFGGISNPWEALLLAQHHGLPTRLLDWTRNPMVAIFFACSKKLDEEDGAIYAIVRMDDEEYDINVLDDRTTITNYKYPRYFRFNLKGIKLIYPPVVTERIRAQNGLFTIQEKTHLPMEEYKRRDYKRKDFDILLIRKWRVPREVKAELIESIHKEGVTATSLFPDIDGIGLGLLQTEVMRSGKRIKVKKT